MFLLQNEVLFLIYLDKQIVNACIFIQRVIGVLYVPSDWIFLFGCRLIRKGRSSYLLCFWLSRTHDTPATVNGQSLPCDEGGRARGQEGDRRGHLVHGPHPAHGVRRLAVLQERLVPGQQRMNREY